MAPPEGFLFSIGGMDVTAAGAAVGISGAVLIVALLSIGAVVAVRKMTAMQMRRISDPRMPPRTNRGVSLEKIGKLARSASDLVVDATGTRKSYAELDELPGVAEISGVDPFGTGRNSATPLTKGRKHQMPPTQGRDKAVSFTQSLQTTEL